MLRRCVRTATSPNPASANRRVNTGSGVEPPLEPSVLVLVGGGVARSDVAPATTNVPDGADVAASTDVPGSTDVPDDADAPDDADGADVPDGAGVAAITALLAMLAEHVILPPPPRPEPLH